MMPSSAERAAKVGRGMAHTYHFLEDHAMYVAVFFKPIDWLVRTARGVDGFLERRDARLALYARSRASHEQAMGPVRAGDRGARSGAFIDDPDDFAASTTTPANPSQSDSEPGAKKLAGYLKNIGPHEELGGVGAEVDLSSAARERFAIDRAAGKLLKLAGDTGADHRPSTSQADNTERLRNLLLADSADALAFRSALGEAIAAGSVEPKTVQGWLVAVAADPVIAQAISDDIENNKPDFVSDTLKALQAGRSAEPAQTLPQLTGGPSGIMGLPG